MNLKWKNILTNWINCYTSEGDKAEQNITPENLLNIFTHIHESFKLDDSKSSKFEASTIQDFIVEKYPEFKFENGTLEATCEEEIYTVASLLLFFICVNSKNAEIKRVMCSKLGMGDQETIMKFSKSLMNCSPILYADVEAAITEACGDTSGGVAETPPALRSLHGEVRRLQAALDAERFDRNYLQDELARTNLKLDKLTKVKEQYKLDILSLKAKISLCCGEQRESSREARTDELVSRLQRQLQELESRLEDTLGQLDDIQQERDTYKKKVADLKEERDKWLSLSQQEADRAGQLSTQLDTERRTVATLRDLVSELRQHNRNNGLDSSMLECDDPDTSIHSLNNLSITNEACANVIEVQLGEERAKIEVLKQQIQSLQEQLDKTNQIFESQKLSLETIITEKESDVSGLKKRINEEIEEKNNLKNHYEQNIDELHKKINEMAQVIKDVEIRSENALAVKVEELQLLQNRFADETNKLGKLIENLQTEIEEKNKVKTECDKEIVKLNNKVTELISTIKDLEETSKHLLLEKEQEIQSLKQKIKNETEKSVHVIQNLHIELKEQIELKTQYEKEIVELKDTIVEISLTLEDVRVSSKHALVEKANQILSITQRYETENEKSSCAIKKLQKQILDQTNVKQLCDEEIAKLNNEIVELTEKIKSVEEKSKHVQEEKEQELQLLQRQLVEQNDVKILCEHEIVILNKKIVDMTLQLRDVEENSELALEEKVQEVKALQQQITEATEKSDAAIKTLQRNIEEHIKLKELSDQEIVLLSDKIVKVSQSANNMEKNLKHALEEKSTEIQTLHKQITDETEQFNNVIKNLKTEIEEKNTLKDNCEREILVLNNKLVATSKQINDLEESSKLAIEEKVRVIQDLQQQLADQTATSATIIINLKNNIEEQKNLRSNCEQEITKLNRDIIEMTQTISKVEERSKIALEDKIQEIQTLRQQLTEETNKLKVLQEEILEASELKTRSDQEIIELNNKVVQILQAIKDTEESSKLALEQQVQEKQSLQQQFVNQTEKTSNIIETLNKELEAEKHIQLKLKEDFENEAMQYKEKLLKQNERLMELNNDVSKKSQIIEQMQSDFRAEQQLRDECEQKMSELNEQKIAVETAFVELQNQLKQKNLSIEKLDKEVNNLKTYASNLEDKYQNVISDKQKEAESLNHEIIELNNKVIEMSKTITDLENKSKLALDEKEQEIASLKEQFAAEGGKSENIIKNFKIELEAEKYAQLKLKDDFDNRIMKLNEKVLNRNNELVELQNNIIHKSELIEVLQSDLRREKELRDELSNTCNHQLSTLNKQKNEIELDLQQKLHDIANLQKKSQEKEMFISKLQIEIENLTTTISSLEEKGRQQACMIKEKQTEIQLLNDVYQKEQEKLNHKIDECNASIKSLQMQLQNEIEYKVKLQRELSELQTSKTMLIEEVDAAKNSRKNYEEKTLMWEKQKHEMNEQIQANIIRVEELENEKAKLVNEVEAINDIQNNELKDHQNKILKWEKQEIEMNKQIQDYDNKVKKLEDEKVGLAKEIEALKAVQTEKSKDHEEIMLVLEKQQMEMNEQAQANTIKIKKLEDDNVTLVNEIETLKAAQSLLTQGNEEKTFMVKKLENEKTTLAKEMNELRTLQKEEMKTHQDKTVAWEKQLVDMGKQIQVNNNKIVELEDEKSVLLKEIEALKSVQLRERKDHDENLLQWGKQMMETEEKLQENVVIVEKYAEEKAILMKEIEVLRAAQNEVTKSHEESVLLWQKQKTEMEAQMQANIQKMENLEEQKVILLKEMTVLKNIQTEEVKDNEEKALLWQKQKTELEQQIQANISKIANLDDEKAMFVKEMELLTAARTKEVQDYKEKESMWQNQKTEMEQQIQANISNIANLEDEKAMFVRASSDIELLKAARTKEIRDHKEKESTWEKQKTEMEAQIQVSVLEVKTFEDEKTLMVKEIESLKAAQSREVQDYNENELKWEKQKTENEKQMQTYVENFEEEKAMLVKEIESLKDWQSKAAQDHKEKEHTWEKQKLEIEEQLKYNVLKLEKLADEKVVLVKDMKALNVIQTGATKDYNEKQLILEKQLDELTEQIESKAIENQKLEEDNAMLLKELNDLKVEKIKQKVHEEEAIMWEKERAELTLQVRVKNLKIEELEEEKAMVLKKVGELMAAEMEEELCLKKNHEEKILMLEKQESEMKEQIQANAQKVEQLIEEKVILLKEIEALKAAQREMLALASQDKIFGPKHTSWEKEIQIHHQVDSTTSDLAHSSMESLKTISDLEKIVQDKNRKITTMQTEITYIKSMMAESGIKLIDVSKELEVSKDTCQELSSQLKKIVQQKNEEIVELKRQVAKMSATENRASQIIKVSAKYQAMILKRIAEIKSSAVLKELTNFGNQNSNGDNDLRRSLPGSVTMEDLENFLETTDRHLRRCSEKQIALQKDRDRLCEVNRINESEIINMKKFLTEMSVSFRTFTTVKDVYNQKLSKIVNLQRTVRREILSLDGRITEATMCKLERGYAAVMQDLSECAMNLERWVDRSVSRLLSAEKIKQAFTSDLEQASLSTCNYQNAAVEVQLSELDNSFQKLLAEIDRAQKGEGARTPQEVTIMELRAEYEDKLNRMKAKMKELLQEEMARLKKKQAEEIAILERELVKSREKMAESSRAYEEHIRSLTTELWSVGEKYLVKQEEADWLRKKQSGSLMSLQHVHSSGLQPQPEVFGRPSDTYSLRSLPVHNKKSEGRGMHMSDEEGEVFDNRFLKELAATPRPSLAPGQRISELKRRNSLVPPHLKSSYPAEMQFAPTLDEEDIKCASTSFSLGRPQRKEVGITAYKKPGPPTPSKQAGRLSATDSELRESLRVEADPQAGRKTSTPSRIRSLFRSNRTDMDVGTPRSRRFSSIFRKK